MTQVIDRSEGLQGPLVVGVEARPAALRKSLKVAFKG
jgi:hypothetical protein